MKWEDIKQLFRANYRVNTSWSYLEEQFGYYREHYGLELTPDFQRSRVWTEDQQKAYVEYILAGGPSAREIQFNCYGWDSKFNAGPVILVDGLQRVTAVQKFLNNELKAYGHYRKEFEGKLPWHNYDFILFMNNLSSLEDVLTWYLQLNAGGIAHTKEELDKVRHMLEQEKLIKHG